MASDAPPGTGAPPLVVAADAATAQEAAALLDAAGWTVTGVDEVPSDPWDLRDRTTVVRLTVDDDGVPDAVLLAARGAGLVVVVDIDDPVTAETFLDQLHRIGRVHDGRALLGRRPTRRLTREETAVLEALAGGASIQEAAARLFLSLRTANRRLASARAALGVDSTRAAVVAHMATRTTD